MEETIDVIQILITSVIEMIVNLNREVKDVVEIGVDGQADVGYRNSAFVVRPHMTPSFVIELVEGQKGSHDECRLRDCRVADSRESTDLRGCRHMPLGHVTSIVQTPLTSRASQIACRRRTSAEQSANLGQVTYYNTEKWHHFTETKPEAQ